MIPTIPYSPLLNPYRHLGGLALLNKDMNSLTYCPKDIGEDYPDKECQSSKSVDTQIINTISILTLKWDFDVHKISKKWI